MNDEFCHSERSEESVYLLNFQSLKILHFVQNDKKEKNL